VTGQSAFGWGAAAGDVYSITSGAGWNRPLVGDRVFLSSDHSENISGSILSYAFSTTQSYGLIQVLSVNRAGSVPPVAADLTSGAAITYTTTGTQSLVLEPYCNMFWQGVTITLAGTTTVANIRFSSLGFKSHYFKNCALVLSSTATGSIGGAGPAKLVFDNTTIQVGAAGQYVGPTAGLVFELTWINTPSAIQGATIPTTLFGVASGNGQPSTIVCRGIDLSAITGTLANIPGGSMSPSKVLLDSCRIASSVARMATPGTNSTTNDEVELVNCYDGTNVINERHTAAGDITIDRSTYLTGGAQDDIGNFSLKLISSSRSDFQTFPLDSFWLDVENTAIGSSHTATVEIISSGTLNNTDIRLLLEYMGTSGSPVASFLESLSSVLTISSALPSSSKTWNSPPSTPQAQLLQITFTPQRAGRVRGLMRLGKVSTTVWVNPQVTVT
jgi:hypothetical protein